MLHITFSLLVDWQNGKKIRSQKRRCKKVASRVLKIAPERLSMYNSLHLQSDRKNV